MKEREGEGLSCQCGTLGLDLIGCEPLILRLQCTAYPLSPGNEHVSEKEVSWCHINSMALLCS